MARFALALLTMLLVAPTIVAADDAEPTKGKSEGLPFHIDLEASYLFTRTDFVSASRVVPLCMNCVPDAERLSMTHLRAGIGWGGIILEGGLALPLQGGSDRHLWEAGVRFDTSWKAVFSLLFRFTYIERWGVMPGRGGRVGVGANIRIVKAFAIFGEAAAEATSVPSEMMRQSGTVLNYATLLGGGVRLMFNP